MSTVQKVNYLFVINDGPYGNERPYNGLRMAMNLAKQEAAFVRLFLIGDGIQCAVRDQDTPKSYYNIGRMVSFIAGRGEVAT